MASLLHRFRFLQHLDNFVVILRNRIRIMNYERLHRRRLQKAPRRTEHGFWFQGPNLFTRKNWEQSEQVLICKLLSNTDLFVNVGANIGFYCCLAQSYNVKTIAFEPDPMNCELFIRNMQHNNFDDDVVLFPIAIGDTFGFTKIFGMWSTVSLIKGFADGVTVPRTVPVAQLDDAVLGHRWASGKLLLLVDVEGWEKFVLRGASRILALVPKPIWIIEVLLTEDDDGPQEQCLEVFELMHEAGYRSYCIGSDESLEEVVEGNDLLNGSFRPSNHNYLFVDSAIEVSEVT